MNPLLSILAGTCLLLALSQQLIGAGAQEDVRSTFPVPTVAGESTPTATKDGKGHGCLGGFMGGKAPGEMKGDQKRPMGSPNRHDFNKMGELLGLGQKQPGQGGMHAGGFGGYQPAAMEAGTRRLPAETKPQ